MIRLQSNQAWHGTDGATVRKIVRDGIVRAPTPVSTRRGYTAPLHGHTYFTRDLGYALMYALGSAMVGRELPPFARFNGEGGVVLVELPEQDGLTPDEDWVGDIACSGYAAELFERGDSGWSHESGAFPANRDLYAQMRAHPKLAGVFRKMASTDVYRLDEVAYQARFGKQIIRALAGTSLLRTLAERASSVSSREGAQVLRAFVFDRRRDNPRLKPDGSNLEDVAEELPVTHGVTAASGLPRGPIWTDYQF